MQTNSRAGTRDMNCLAGTDIDRLTSWAQRNPQQLFQSRFLLQAVLQTPQTLRAFSVTRVVFPLQNPDADHCLRSGTNYDYHGLRRLADY